MEPIEIVFATSSCVYRSLWGFAVVFGLIAIAVPGLIFSKGGLQWQLAGVLPKRMDRLAFFSFFGVVVCFAAALAFFAGVSQTISTLIASGNRIEVTGCRFARPFTSVFDRSEMKASYVTDGEGSKHGYLVLSQNGQRKVEFRLGDYITDRKLTVVAPEAMQLYFDEQK